MWTGLRDIRDHWTVDWTSGLRDHWIQHGPQCFLSHVTATVPKKHSKDRSKDNFKKGPTISHLWRNSLD